MKNHVIVRWRKDNKDFFAVKEKEELIEGFNALIVQDLIKSSDSEELIRIIRVSDDIFINWDETKETDTLELHFWITDGSKGKMDIEKEHKIVRNFLSQICYYGKDIPQKFTMRWQVAGKEYFKTLDRHQVENEFQIILDRNPENNLISKRIVHIMPMLEEAYISWDSTAENNSLFYKTYDNYKEYKGIEIISHHKKVWAKLKELCDMV